MYGSVGHRWSACAHQRDKTELTVTEQGYTVDWTVDLSAAGMNQVLDKMAALFAAEEGAATPSATPA